jgi:hypothetical protein
MLDDANLREGDLVSKERRSSSGLFDTLQSKHGDGRATVGRHAESP